MPTAANAMKLGNKRKLLDDSDSDSEDGGAALSNGFKVDEEFARRLEHNKKREERQRCMLHFLFFNAPILVQIWLIRDL
jgi:predicted nucleic acid-binding Zn ribbon protein